MSIPLEVLELPVMVNVLMMELVFIMRSTMVLVLGRVVSSLMVLLILLPNWK